MSNLESFNFDDGVKEYAINNDERRILKVNVSDIGLVDRIEASIRHMEKAVEGIKDVEIDENGEATLDKFAEPIREANKAVRKEFDAVFYPGASNIVFGKQNPLSTVDGITIYERFMRAFLEKVKPEIEKEQKASDEHIAKYKAAYSKPKLPDKVVAGK